MKSWGFILAVLFTLGLPSLAAADPVTLRFNELSTRPVNGVSIGGVTFSFTVNGVASTDAVYNATTGPVGTRFLQCPCLEGAANGALTVRFADPVNRIQFGLALPTFVNLQPGFTVQLFNANAQLIGTFPVNTSPVLTFSEAQFSYLGAHVTTMVITFNPNRGRFALDNLTFETPEPATLTLMMLGLGGMAGVIRRKRKLRE
jgi:hypothetical protein